MLLSLFADTNLLCNEMEISILKLYHPEWLKTSLLLFMLKFFGNPLVYPV